jgi:ribosome-associated protein
MLDTAAKKDTAKLQRAIIDGLEDVKAQDIVVFDTEHLSSLFERVIIASGTSNRQTKGLASSVSEAVRKAGFPKPRVEGEDNGEWIIVDCLQCVVHIMQPAIRTYYHLEEIWGDKPIRLKLGAPKPAQATPTVPEPVAAKSKKPAAKKAAPGKRPKRPEPEYAGPRPETAPLSRAKKAAIKTTSAAKTAVAKAPASKTAAGKTSATKTPAKKSAPAKVPVKTVGKPPAKKAAPAKRTRA